MAQASATQRDTANYRWWGTELFAFLLRRKGGKRLTPADVITYLFLIVGTIVMFFPVLWLVMSSFKPITTLYQTPPTSSPITLSPSKWRATLSRCRSWTCA